MSPEGSHSIRPDLERFVGPCCSGAVLGPLYQSIIVPFLMCY
jgi:hypothetical protein